MKSYKKLQNFYLFFKNEINYHSLKIKILFIININNLLLFLMIFRICFILFFNIFLNIENIISYLIDFSLFLNEVLLPKTYCHFNDNLVFSTPDHTFLGEYSSSEVSEGEEDDLIITERRHTLNLIKKEIHKSQSELLLNSSSFYLKFDENTINQSLYYKEISLEYRNITKRHILILSELNDMTISENFKVKDIDTVLNKVLINSDKLNNLNNISFFNLWKNSYYIPIVNNTLLLNKCSPLPESIIKDIVFNYLGYKKNFQNIIIPNYCLANRILNSMIYYTSNNISKLNNLNLNSDSFFINRDSENNTILKFPNPENPDFLNDFKQRSRRLSYNAEKNLFKFLIDLDILSKIENNNINFPRQSSIKFNQYFIPINSDKSIEELKHENIEFLTETFNRYDEYLKKDDLIITKKMKFSYEEEKN